MAGAAAAATRADSPHAPSASPSGPRSAAEAQIKAAVLRFVAWSHDHPGARCPDAAALGAGAPDPWGRSLRVLCIDQPADQIAGVLSLGPDGLPGTPDDLASWTLGPEVTELLRGAPWSSRQSVSTSTGSRRPAAPASPDARRSASAGAGSSDTDGDGIPDRR